MFAIAVRTKINALSKSISILLLPLSRSTSSSALNLGPASVLLRMRPYNYTNTASSVFWIIERLWLGAAVEQIYADSPCFIGR